MSGESVPKDDPSGSKEMGDTPGSLKELPLMRAGALMEQEAKAWFGDGLQII